MNLFQLLFGEWLQLLFGFSGRINRAKYWLTFVIYFVALFALYVLFSLFFSFPTDLLGLFLILSRAAQAYIWSTPLVSMTTWRDNQGKAYGVTSDTDLVVLEVSSGLSRCTARTPGGLMTTAARKSAA